MRRLGCAGSTARNPLYKAYLRLGTRTRAGAIRRATEMKLLSAQSEADLTPASGATMSSAVLFEPTSSSLIEISTESD